MARAVQYVNHKQEEKQSVKSVHVLNSVIFGVGGGEENETYFFKDLLYCFEILFKLHENKYYKCSTSWLQNERTELFVSQSQYVCLAIQVCLHYYSMHFQYGCTGSLKSSCELCRNTCS